MDAVTSPKLAPYLVVTNADGLAKFIETGIGGTRGFQQLADDGRVNHLEMRVADAVIMLADAPTGRAPFPAMLHLYVGNADEAYARALRAGATSVRPPTDAPDGRRGGVRDRWGNEWWFTQPRDG